MTGFVLRRLLISIPVVVLASFLVFALVAASGDPLADLRLNPNASQATLELRARELNLDKPIPQRYAIWASAAIRGDLGIAVDKEPVSDKLRRGFGVTFRLVILATLLAVLVAVSLGVYSAVRQYSIGDYAGTFFAFVFFSMPVFWLAGILKDLGIRFNQAVGSTIFYTVGERTPNLTGGFFDTLGNRLGHLALPTLTLALLGMAAWSRFQRAAMLDVLNADYVRTARAKGLSEFQVITKHALRNALIPLTTVVALDFASTIGGAIITERVFAWKGMGSILLEGIDRLDVNVVTGWLVVTAVVVVVFNLIADILYAVLDPRIRNA
ncbi:MAG: ABC transporter permease [Actinobacteria bacterium]|nr:ABC transporter permease [Actinomycetota bacterium]